MSIHKFEKWLMNTRHLNIYIDSETKFKHTPLTVSENLKNSKYTRKIVHFEENFIEIGRNELDIHSWSEIFYIEEQLREINSRKISELNDEQDEDIFSVHRTDLLGDLRKEAEQHFEASEAFEQPEVGSLQPLRDRERRFVVNSEIRREVESTNMINENEQSSSLLDETREEKAFFVR